MVTVTLTKATEARKGLFSLRVLVTVAVVPAVRERAQWRALLSPFALFSVQDPTRETVLLTFGVPSCLHLNKILLPRCAKRLASSK